MDKEKVTAGLYVGKELGGGNFSAKNVIEDFMKTEYQEGLRNEFNMMDALINKLPKDSISGKKKYKSFALGITDNVRAVGSGTFDRYELGFGDFYGKGTETVEAEFDTTKLMATFAITDEAILKGTGDGSLFDVLKDSLNRMEIGLKHTYNRYIYGGHEGKIGEVREKLEVVSLSSVTASAAIDRGRDNRGEYHNQFDYGKAPLVLKFAFTNSHSLIEGMGAMIEVKTFGTAAGDTGAKAKDIVKTVRLIGRIWQKDNTEIHSEKVLFIVEKAIGKAAGASSWSAETISADISYVAPTYSSGDQATDSATIITVFSRQLDDEGNVAAEYHGLEDIVVTKDNKIFGVDRAIYKSLNCTQVDLMGRTKGLTGGADQAKFLNEEILRDLSDHLALSSPDGTAVSLCCANHRIISQVEKAMYQFKNYNLSSVSQGMQLGGGSELKFDNYFLFKDKYARDNNLYMLDQAKIGELVRRDFTWITSGEVNGVLQRRPGTEMYEGIMNKYADMYIDAWRCHAVIKDCPVVSAGTFFSYGADGQPKAI